MPQFIQAIAQVIPLTHFLPAFRILIIENGTFDLTYPYIVNMTIIALVGFMLSFIALHLKKQKVLKELLVTDKDSMQELNINEIQVIEEGDEIQEIKNEDSDFIEESKKIE